MFFKNGAVNTDKQSDTKSKGYTLSWSSTLDILLTISNFATTCQLTLIRVLVDC